MAIDQEYKERRVNDLPTSGLSAGDKYALNVGGGKYQTYIVSDALQLVKEAGAEFIEKDTMAEMRALSAREIWALQNGYYKGVKLNGYYAEGDTPTSIDYYISSTSATDDGGSVIEVGGIKLKHEFIDFIDIAYFGIRSGEDSTSRFVKYIEAIKRYGINKIDINKEIDIYETVSISDIVNLDFKISKDIKFTPYRGVTFLNCPDISISGEINGMGLSTVGLTLDSCPRFKVCNFKAISFGSTSLNQVRALELVGDCSYGKIDKCTFKDIISSSVAVGIVISPSVDGLKWSKYCTITNSDFINIQPSTDADAIKTLLLGKWAHLTIDNCYFKDCAKRAFKSQSRGDIISNCTIDGETKYAIDFQDGHGKAFNIRGTINSTWEALLSALNYNVEFYDINFDTTLPIESITNVCRGLDITKITTTDGLTQGYVNIRNVTIDKCSELRVRSISGLTLSIDNLTVNMNKASYLLSFNSQSMPLLKVTNSKLITPNSTFYGVATGVDNISDFIIDDNFFNKPFLAGRSTSVHSKDVTYINNEKSDYAFVLYYTQKGTRRIYQGVTGIPTTSTALFLDSLVGDIAYHRNPQTSGIDKYLCIASGNGTDSAGTWKTIYLSELATTSVKGLVNQISAQANISQADLVATTSPAATVDTASTATDVAGLLTDLNDLMSRYNVAVALINELKTKYDLNVTLTNAIKTSQNTELTNQRTAGQQAT